MRRTTVFLSHNNMKVFASVLYVCALVQFTFGWVGPAQSGENKSKAAIKGDTGDRYIIELKESQVPFEELMNPHRAILNNGDNKVLKEYSQLYGFLAQIRDKNVLEKIQTIAQVSGARPVSRSINVKGSITSQKIQPNFWNLDYLDGQDNAYRFREESIGSVVVYLLDSGVNLHSGLKGRVILNETMIDGLSAYDGLGHGTHVAGLIAGTLSGVAKKVQIGSIKVVDNTGWGTWAQFIDGILRVIEHHKQRRAQNPKAASVINISLGDLPDEMGDRAVRLAIRNNITVAVAAGNNGTSACMESPGRVKEAITVAASGYDNELAIWSNRGSCIDLIAPGSAITSSDAFNLDEGYVTFAGTSMAAPHVAGAAALVLQKNPELTPRQVAQRLQQIAKKNVIRLPYLNYYYDGGDFQNGSPLDRETPNLFLQVPRP